MGPTYFKNDPTGSKWRQEQNERKEAMEMVQGEYEENLKYNMRGEEGPEGQELTRNKNRSKEPLLRSQMTSPAQEVKAAVETRLVGGMFWM